MNTLLEKLNKIRARFSENSLPEEQKKLQEKIDKLKRDLAQ